MPPCSAAMFQRGQLRARAWRAPGERTRPPRDDQYKDDLSDARAEESRKRNR